MINVLKQYSLGLSPNVCKFWIAYYFTNDTAKQWHVCISIMHTRILKILCYVLWNSIAFITVWLNIKVWFVAKVLKQYFIIYECVIYILSCLFILPMIQLKCDIYVWHKLDFFCILYSIHSYYIHYHRLL